MTRRDIRTGCAMLAVLALTACGSDGSFDPDLRGLIGGMDTAPAAAAAAAGRASTTRSSARSSWALERNQDSYALGGR